MVNYKIIIVYYEVNYNALGFNCPKTADFKRNDCMPSIHERNRSRLFIGWVCFSFHA